MTAEMIILPTPEDLREEAYQIWSMEANRHTARTRRILEQRYQDFPDLGLPQAATIRQWVHRDGWHERATREMAEGYPHEARRFRWSLWRYLQLGMEAMYDDITGVKPMSKITHANIKLAFEAAGVGALGFNQGGEMAVSFEQEQEQLSEMTVDERLRRLRAINVEANTGNG